MGMNIYKQSLVLLTNASKDVLTKSETRAREHSRMLFGYLLLFDISV